MRFTCSIFVTTHHNTTGARCTFRFGLCHFRIKQTKTYPGNREASCQLTGPCKKLSPRLKLFRLIRCICHHDLLSAIPEKGSTIEDVKAILVCWRVTTIAEDVLGCSLLPSLESCRLHQEYRQRVSLALDRLHLQALLRASR